MAAFTKHQAPTAPLQDLPPNSPAEQNSFHPNNNSNRHSMGNGVRTHQARPSGEFRGQNGSKAIPAGPHAHMAPNAGHRNPGAHGNAGGFDGPRSPPNTKNTSHVPCKFFKIGQCQAGKACPFSHSTDSSKFDQPCKYFSKGNCKFGHKCALLHILQNGRIVNRPNTSQGLNIGGRVEPMPAQYHQESALGNSLAQQAGGQVQPFNQQLQFMHDMEPSFQQSMSSQASQPYDIPRPSSSYVTPSREAPMSPPTHLSTLDAPLPASFDSQGISYMARHGPVAASVPSKFGLESPPASLPQKNAVAGGAIRNLHESAFGSSKVSGFGTSPSGTLNESGVPRVMHSQRMSRPRMMSASLPRPNVHDDWEDDALFNIDDEYGPNTMGHLFSGEEKHRRTSNKYMDDPHAIRESLAQVPTDFSNKIGSPSAASPSRFSALFSKQKREEEEQNRSNAISSSFGHVGSPLRNSALHLGTSPSMRIGSRTSSSEMAFKLSSPPQHSSIHDISQAMSNTRLSNPGSNEMNPRSPNLYPSTGRLSSNSRAGMDRAVSSSSVTTSRIDEEQQEFVFPLDEDLGAPKPSTNSPWNQPSRSGALGPIGDGRRSMDAKEANGMKVPEKKSL